MKKKKSSSNIIYAAIAIAIAAFLIYRTRNKAQHPQATAEKATKALVSEAPKQELLEVTETKSTPLTAAQKRAYSSMLMTGIREIPSRAKSGMLHMKVRAIGVPMGCSLGDIDFVKGAIDNINKDDFLISVETMKGSKAKTYSFRTSLNEIMDGRIIDVALPQEEGARDYALSICFDFAKSNECKSKPLLQAKEWKTLLSSIKKNDRTFYYQMITVREQRAFLIPSFKWDAKSIQNLKTALKPIIQSEESIDDFKKNIQVLSSVPGRISKDVLELPLPQQDTNCR